MNWDQIQGSWQELKGKVRSKWAKLTDDDLDQIKGKKDVLLGRLQQRYGFEKDRAEKELDTWLGSFKTERVPREERVEEDEDEDIEPGERH